MVVVNTSRAWGPFSTNRLIAALATVAVIATTVTAQSPAMGASDGGAQRAAASADWPASPAPRTSKKVVTGTTSGARPVYLQRQVPGTWVTVAQGTSSAAGTYTLPLPTQTLGKFTYRVVAASLLAPPTVLDISPKMVVRPKWNPAGTPSDHEFMSEELPVRWNPCEVIRYRVNDQQALPGAVKAVKTAVAHIEISTGLRFKYQGTSDRVPRNDGGNYNYGADTQMLVAWASPAQSDILGSGRGIVGMGGPVFFDSGYQDGAGRPMGLAVKGQVVMNTQYNRALKAGTSQGSLRVESLMHEIGHVVGLSHARGPSQVMYGNSGGTTSTEWGAGDLEGLRKVGFSGGCVSPEPTRQQSSRTLPGTVSGTGTAPELMARFLP